MTDLAEFEWEFADLPFGGTSDIGFVEGDGLDDLPEFETNDQPRSGVDGLWAGQDFARGRTINLTLELKADDDATFRTMRDQLKAAFSLRRSSDAALRFRLPGEPTKRVLCRTRRRSIPTDFDLVTRLQEAKFQLSACDPRIYADDLESGDASVDATAAGVNFPINFPVSFGGTSSDRAVLASNDGDFPAPWTATIAGPVTDPRLTLAATGQQLSLTGTVAEGDSLTLDSLARTILLNGSASRYEWLEAGSEWFDLAPGENEVQFAAGDGTGTLTLAWRSAWL